MRGAVWSVCGVRGHDVGVVVVCAVVVCACRVVYEVVGV